MNDIGAEDRPGAVPAPDLSDRTVPAGPPGSTVSAPGLSDRTVPAGPPPASGMGSRGPALNGSDPTPLREALDAVTRALGGPAASTLSAVFSRWSELVGGEVAAHARPLSLRDGLLVIGADQSVWRTQLTYLEADLLRRIAEALGPGVVTRIEVRVRPPTS